MISKGVRIILEVDYDVTLKMILSDINQGEKLNWRIFYVWAIKNGEKSHLDMRLNELNTDEGYPLSWTELFNFSEDIIQLIDGVFIGSTSKDIQLNNDYEKYEYRIEMIDGGMWEIFTTNKSFYECIVSKYKISDYLNKDFEDHIYDDFKEH